MDTHTHTHTHTHAKQQICNVEKRVLYWKRMPSKAFLAREKSVLGFKASKHMLAILVGGNQPVTSKLLIYHYENPSPLRIMLNLHCP